MQVYLAFLFNFFQSNTHLVSLSGFDSQNVPMQSMLNSWHNRHWPIEVGKCASSEVLVLKWLYDFMP